MILAVSQPQALAGYRYTLRQKCSLIPGGGSHTMSGALACYLVTTLSSNSESLSRGNFQFKVAVIIAVLFQLDGQVMPVYGAPHGSVAFVANAANF